MHAFLQVKFFWVKLSFAKPVSLFVITAPPPTPAVITLNCLPR